MQLPRPHLYTSPRIVGLVERPQMVPHEGPISDAIYGYHTLWIAEVPFIPTFISESHRDFDSTAANRVTYAMQRQIRFLYDLAKSSEHLATFELRLVSWPRPDGFSQVGIAFLGKTFHEDEATSQRLALELWNKFSAIFPREAPFSYPLVPVVEEGQNYTGQTHTFSQWYQPIPFANIERQGSLVELRKYEDWPTIRDVGGVLHARDYIPHPFMAALDYSAMARLFETLARQQRICIVSITLRPQPISDQEAVILHELAGWYQRVARGEAHIENPLAEVLREFKSDVFEAYLGARAELGRTVYESLVREHLSLFTVRLQVIGDPFVENDLIEALGSEVMANAGNAYPSRWTRVEPADEQELRWACFNLQWLEFARWGISPIIRRVPSIIRLRQLATVPEAAGAFRLPVAPSNGGIAGVVVRDEPFGPPTATPPARIDTSFFLGTLLDRGVPTEHPLMLPVDVLGEFIYLFGDTSKPRSCVLRELLKGATKYGIPWVLIRRKGEDSKFITEGLPVRYAAVDALASTPTLMVQPFLPPPGVSYNAFLDALVRVFATICQLEAATAIVLRRALVEVYESAGWIEQDNPTFDLTALAAKLETAIQRQDTPADLSNTLHTQCLLPLQDLAMTAGKICNTPTTQQPHAQITTPLVVEIGWVGSDTSNAILQGCLWTWFALACSVKTAVTEQGLRGIVAVEDAHAVFHDNSSSLPVPTSALARMLARAGVGTILIDDRPDLLNKEITSKPGITLLTRNANETALEKVAELLGLKEREKMRTRRLTPNEALVAQPGCAPTLITIP